MNNRGGRILDDVKQREVLAILSMGCSQSMLMPRPVKCAALMKSGRLVLAVAMSRNVLRPKKVSLVASATIGFIS